jgi:hypothetical protein
VQDELNYETCPVCGHGNWKFFVNQGSGVFHCFAGRCPNPNGRVLDHHLLPRYSNARATAKGDSEKEVTLPETSEIIKGTPAFRYLSRRNITANTIRELSLRDWALQFRVLIPYFNGRSEVVYYSARDYLGISSRKYVNAAAPKTLYAPHQSPGCRDAGVRAPDDPLVVLVEGQLDAVAIHQCARETGIPARALAIGGCSVPEHCRPELIRQVTDRRALIWLDSDAPGQRGAIQLMRQIEPHAREIRLRWHGDCKDAGDTPAPELARILQEAQA